MQVGQQRNSNDKAKKDKWSDAEEDDEEDKSLVLGKYKYLEDVPREVCLSYLKGEQDMYLVSHTSINVENTTFDIIF